MTIYLANAFSLNMIEIGPQGVCVEIEPVTPHDIPADAVSIIGHEDMAGIVAGILGREVTINRGTVTLLMTDVLYVAQYRGQRLPGGVTTLPEGARLEFYRLTLHREKVLQNK